MHRGPVLVDNNVLVECHRAGCWRALRGAYGIETVEKCVEEFLTGPKSALAGKPGEVAGFRADFAAVHEVTRLQMAEIALIPIPVLDDGERELWAHARTRADDWLLCGPDKASMRWGFENGFRQRLVSLEKLLSDAGIRPAQPLRANYGDAWFRALMVKLVMGIL